MRLTHEFHCKDLLDASGWEDEAPGLLAGANMVSVGAFGEAAWHVVACLCSILWQCMASVSSTTGHKMEQAHSCVPRLLQYLQKAALLLRTPVWPGLNGHGGDLH